MSLFVPFHLPLGFSSSLEAFPSLNVVFTSLIFVFTAKQFSAGPIDSNCSVTTNKRQFLQIRRVFPNIVRLIHRYLIPVKMEDPQTSTPAPSSCFNCNKLQTELPEPLKRCSKMPNSTLLLSRMPNGSLEEPQNHLPSSRLCPSSQPTATTQALRS